MNPSLPFGCMSSTDYTRFCFYETKDTIFHTWTSIPIKSCSHQPQLEQIKRNSWASSINGSGIVERAIHKATEAPNTLCTPSWCEGLDECLGSGVLPSSSTLGRYHVNSVRQTIFVIAAKAAIRPVPPCSKLSHFLTIQEEREKENCSAKQGPICTRTA